MLDDTAKEVTVETSNLVDVGTYTVTIKVFSKYGVEQTGPSQTLTFDVVITDPCLTATITLPATVLPTIPIYNKDAAATSL